MTVVNSKSSYAQGMRRLMIVVLAFAVSLPHVANADVLSNQTKMVLVKTITGGISPKSVTSSGMGLVSAQNMMYTHSVTIYDGKTQQLIKRVSDSVKLRDFGYTQYSGTYKGSPVEGTFSPDGKYLYVTNYAIYGAGFGEEGTDVCSPASDIDPSFVYRINLTKFTIDGLYPVGSMPKGIAITPDNKYLLVANWCSYTLDVISIAAQKTVKQLKIGAYPRGIVISADSKKAYVAEMGGISVHEINLSDFTQKRIPVGLNPRAVVLSPDNSKMYVTLNSAGKVVAWDLKKNKAIGSVKTGEGARSLAISSDGTSIFVVNYDSDTVAKVNASDMSIIQTVKPCIHPIGITYDAPTSTTWVACYSGSIKVFSN